MIIQKTIKKINNKEHLLHLQKKEILKSNNNDILSDELVKKLEERIPTFNRAKHNEHLVSLFSQFL